MMARFKVALALLLALACFSGPVEAKTARGKGDASPSMAVVVVRSSEEGCEPLCPEWIAADGRITAATPQAFRAAFKTAGTLNLPIILHSPGGDVDAAIAIGRMIRQRKATVIIGQANIQGCQPSDKGCKPSATTHGRYPTGFIAAYGSCYSACGLVLAGGVTRMSRPNSIGTHQMVQTGIRERVWYHETYRMVHGRKKVLSRQITKRQRFTTKPTIQVSPKLRKKVNTYLAEMGISPTFFALFEKAPPSGIYILSEPEMTATRITNFSLGSEVMMRKDLCEGAVPAANCVKAP
jgi:hypothetical protein